MIKRLLPLVIVVTLLSSCPNPKVTEILHVDKGVHEWMLSNSDSPEDILKQIYKSTNKYERSDLLLAICKVESSFNPFTKSHKNARGLMGVVPKWWMDELMQNGVIDSKRDLYDIEGGVAAGNYILNKYFSKHKDIRTALLKYSGGDKKYPTKVFAALGEIKYARTEGKWN
jgi:soluble lytic murein transglycosylase-like protein